MKTLSKEKPEMENTQDAFLVEQAKKDMKHFEKLYLKYHSLIFRFLHKRVVNTSAVNDLTSQVFLKAMQNLHKYEHKGFPFSSWLYRIALSETGNMFRAEKAERALKIEWEKASELLTEVDPDNEFRIDNMALSKALNELNDEQLNMVEMRFFEKIRLKEIATIMEITESNAKVKMHRTMKKVKKIMMEL